MRQFLPKDPTKEEIKILNTIAVNLYQRIPDPTDKFIVAMVFDMGYGKEDTAAALNVSHVTVWKRINKIKKILFEEYKPQRILKD